MPFSRKYGQEMRRQSLRIPAKLDDALRQKAKKDKSLKSEVIVSVLADAMNINLAPEETGIFE